jgi:hypothetical protein
MNPLCLLLAAALGGFTPSNLADIGGPIRLRNESPFQLIFMSTPPIDARIPKRPRWEVEVLESNNFNVSDTINSTPAYQAVVASSKPVPISLSSLSATAKANPNVIYNLSDTEITKLAVRYTRPFGNHWCGEVEVPVYTYSGGFMDPVIDAFHAAFGFNPWGRQYFPENQSQVFFGKGNSQLAFNGQRGPNFGDITLRAIHQVRPDRHGWPAVALSTALKLPTGNRNSAMGSGCFDGDVGLHLTHHWGQSWFYGTAGANFLGGWRSMPDVPVRNTADYHLGYEYRVNNRWSTLVSLSDYGSPIAASGNQSIGQPSLLTAMTARYNAGDYELEFGYLEHINRNTNSHDVVLYSRIRFWP